MLMLFNQKVLSEAEKRMLYFYPLLDFLKKKEQTLKLIEEGKTSLSIFF